MVVLALNQRENDMNTAQEHALLNTDCETEINGYTVELEFIDDGGDTVSQCWITRGDYGSSLECLNAFGTIDNDGDEHVCSFSCFAGNCCCRPKRAS